MLLRRVVTVARIAPRTTLSRRLPQIPVSRTYCTSKQILDQQKSTATLRAQIEADWAAADKRDLRPLDRHVLEAITGVPVSHLTRTVRIEKQSKPVDQHGWGTARDWDLRFQHGEGWTNPLMGWTSSRDPLRDMVLNFPTAEAAIKFAQTNGFEYHLDEQTHMLAQSRKTYASKHTYKPPRTGLNPAEEL